MRTNKLFVFAVGLLPFSIWSAFQEGRRLINRLQVLEATPQRATSSISTITANPHNTRHDGAPLFILHIGPPKTGTTSIQYFSGENEQMLRHDNIYYLGQYKKRQEMRVHDLCFSCLMGKEKDCQQKWRDLESKVNYHFEQNHTVMMSEENFIVQDAEGDNEEHLWKYLEPMLSKWNVRVIFTYRRYYEWLPSWYHQYHNPNGDRGTKKKRFLLWPDGKRRVIPPFRSFFQQHIDNDFNLLVEVKKWKAKFSDVRVINMHSGGETVRQMFCNAIPEAKKLCDVASRAKKFKTKNSSKVKYVHFDMIAMGAYREGLVKAGLSRTEVRQAVEAHSPGLGFSKLTDFPLLCLTKKQAGAFLNLSLAFESELLPEFHSTSTGAEELKAGFSNSLEMGTFCSVDVKSVLKDERWQEFFTTLGTEAESR